MSRLLKTELLKLKATPVLLFILGAVLFVSIIDFTGHLNDPQSLAILGKNPWNLYFTRALGIYSIFVICPFIVLLVSYIITIEQGANGWKYIYTMPISRGKIFFVKLFVILVIVFLSILLMWLGVWASGWIISVLFPESELSYKPAQFAKWSILCCHLFIASLGLVGLHYALSLRFKNFIITAGIGMAGFIGGIILTGMSAKVGLYFPYAQVMTVRDFGMFSFDKREDLWTGSWLNNVELFSIILFLIFTLLAYFYETRRNID